MNSMRNVIENTVPISAFNKGLAGKIFQEVKKSGAKVVMKNNSAECVLLSPEDYIELLDMVNDAQMASLVSERMAHYNPANLISAEEADKICDISKEDLAGFEEVEIE